jgi:hypothetical protein
MPKLNKTPHLFPGKPRYEANASFFLLLFHLTENKQEALSFKTIVSLLDFSQTPMNPELLNFTGTAQRGKQY